LDGLARRDLLAAIDAFEAGLEYLYQAIDTKAEATTTGARERNENLKELSSTSTTATVKTVALTAEMTNIQLTEFSESIKSAFSQAEKRFKMSREEATRAFNNEALSTFDRITAIRYRVMATMLESAVETVGTAGDVSSLSVKSVLKRALPECEQCLRKLHFLPDVQNNFKAEFEKGLLNIKGRFGKDERREIISAVCQVNRAIYDASQTASKNVLLWPSVDIGADKIDPLRDPRMTQVLRKVRMEHCCVTPWSLGQEGEKEHNLKNPGSIATNTDGQFIVADHGDHTVKVFSSSGKFLFSFKPHTDDAPTKLQISGVATDFNSNTYVLVMLDKPGAWECEVQVHKNGDLLNKFPVRSRDLDWGRLTVSSNNKVLVLGLTNEDKYVVDVYEHDGGCVCSFGEEILKGAADIAAAPDGSVMVADRDDSCVHVFTEDGTQLKTFHMKTEARMEWDRMACHSAGEHVVVACIEQETFQPRVVYIYTKDGELVRSVALDKEIIGLGGITVTMEGHIAVAVKVPSEYEHSASWFCGKVIIVR